MRSAGRNGDVTAHRLRTSSGDKREVGALLLIGALLLRWSRRRAKTESLQTPTQERQLLVGTQLSQPIDIGLHGSEVPTSLVVEALCVAHGSAPIVTTRSPFRCRDFEMASTW